MMETPPSMPSVPQAATTTTTTSLPPPISQNPNSNFNSKTNTVDPLPAYLQTTTTTTTTTSMDDTNSKLSHIRNELTTNGYAIIPSVLTSVECEHALDCLWDFVQDVSGGLVRRDDPRSWYPPNQSQLPVLVSEDNANTNTNEQQPLSPTTTPAKIDHDHHPTVGNDEDPWPYTGGDDPDKFQSLGAGFVLGDTRQILAERLFEPFFGMRELHVSKEGFTFARPTLVDVDGSASGSTSTMRWNRSPSSTTTTTPTGESQPLQHCNDDPNTDQSHALQGLYHTLQSSITLIDQDPSSGDGHFIVYPYSQQNKEGEEELDGVRRSTSQIRLDDERKDSGNNHNDSNTYHPQQSTSSTPLPPKHIYTKAGDVILYRPDVIHTIAPPSPETPHFCAVGFVSMCPARFTDPHDTTNTNTDIMNNTTNTTAAATTAKRKVTKTMETKMDAYRWGMTGDGNPSMEHWVTHCRRQREDDSHNHNSNNSESETKLNDSDGINWVLERQRPYYRLSPPLVTPRLAELYGLIPYNLDDSPAETQKAREMAMIRGVRFRPLPPPPLESNTTTTTTTGSTASSGDGTSSGDYGPPCYARTKSLTLANQTPLIGQDKYLGGMCSPCGRYVYGVPGHATRVLRINTATDEMDLIGPVYKGQFKWLRGVEVPGVDGGSGCCLALPCNSRNVLKIVVDTGEVKTFGDIDEKGWLYHGGNLAADGYVYAIPANATRVLKIHPHNETISYLGPSYPGHQKWFGGILASDGCIYGIPHNATGVLKINPFTQTVSIVSDGYFPPSRWKYHGGLSINNGTKILGFPNNADDVMVFDVLEQRAYTVGDVTVLTSGRHRIPQDRRYKYLGGAVSEDGRFTYLFPCDAERVLRIDNDTLALTLVGPELLEGANKYQNGFVSGDGCLYGIPQRASGVVRITPVDVLRRLDPEGGGDLEDRVDVLHCGDDMIRYKDKFEGGVMDFNGNIYCIPLRAKALLKVIPAPSL